MLAEQKLRGVYAGIALSGAASEMALARVPSMSELELGESIDWEYAQRLSYKAQQGVFDYQVAGEGNDRRDVLLAGAKRDTLSRYLNVMRGAGLTLSCVEICSLALANAFGYNYESERENCFLIHAGAEVTEVVALEKGQPLFSRSIEGGGNEVTEAIEAELGVDFERAESLKLERELPSDVGGKVERISNEVAEKIVSGIKKALDDFASVGSSGLGERAVLSGGCVKLPAFVHQLRRQLPAKLELVNPFRRVDYRRFNQKKIIHVTPEAAVATGLALRGVLRP